MALRVSNLRSIRLPNPEELDSDEQRLLRENDLRELHSRDRLGRLDYVMRVNRVRREVARQLPRGALVVDVGCAQGNLAILLRAHGFRVLATDLRLDFLRYARLKSLQAQPWAVVCSGEALPVGSASADAVILGEILEHVAHPTRFLYEAARVLRPGGLLVATTPNGSHRWNPLPTYVEARGHLHDFEPRQFGPDGGDHLFLYRENELRELLRQSGFCEPAVTYFYSDITARAISRIRALPLWSRTSGLVSPALGRLVAISDRAVLRLVPRDRLALGLVVAARKL